MVASENGVSCRFSRDYETVVSTLMQVQGNRSTHAYNWKKIVVTKRSSHAQRISAVWAAAITIKIMCLSSRYLHIFWNYHDNITNLVESLLRIMQMSEEFIDFLAKRRKTKRREYLSKGIKIFAQNIKHYPEWTCHTNSLSNHTSCR